MPWVSLSLQVDAASAEGLADALLERGAISVELTDADAGRPGEIPLFWEPGEAPDARWPRSRLSALFDAGVDPAQAVAAACWAVEVPVPADLHTEPVQDQDWVRATQQQFGPIEISPRMWIAPSWCEPPDPSALVLRLDPGLAFGTGAHPTTWQCLRWLDEHLRSGQSVLDYGCGSGILAIAAKKLGAGRVVATDIDPDALQVSLDNALQNGVALDLRAPDALGAERFGCSPHCWLRTPALQGTSSSRAYSRFRSKPYRRRMPNGSILRNGMRAKAGFASLASDGRPDPDSARQREELLRQQRQRGQRAPA